MYATKLHTTKFLKPNVTRDMGKIQLDSCIRFFGNLHFGSTLPRKAVADIRMTL